MTTVPWAGVFTLTTEKRVTVRIRIVPREVDEHLSAGGARRRIRVGDRRLIRIPRRQHLHVDRADSHMTIGVHHQILDRVLTHEPRPSA